MSLFFVLRYLLFTIFVFIPVGCKQESPSLSSGMSKQAGLSQDSSDGVDLDDPPKPKVDSPPIPVTDKWEHHLSSGIVELPDCDKFGPYNFAKEYDFLKIYSVASESGFYLPKQFAWKNIPVPVFIGENFSKFDENLARYSFGIWEVATGKNLFEFKGRVAIEDMRMPDYKGEFIEEDNHKIFMYLGNFDLPSIYKGKKGQAAGRADTRAELNKTMMRQLMQENPEMSEEEARKKSLVKATYIYVRDIFTRRDIDKDDYDEKRSRLDKIWDASVTRSIMIHEVGHALGLDHVTGIDSVMSYDSPGDLGVLSCEDIARVQHMYGCKEPFCDHKYVMRVFDSEEFQKLRKGVNAMEDPFNDPGSDDFILE